MRYPVILIFLIMASGCASRQPVSFDADVAQVMPESAALEVLHERQPPEVASQHPGYNFCLFSPDTVKSMKSGGVLGYQKLAFTVTREWADPGKEFWGVKIIHADSGEIFCRYALTVERSNSEGRAKAQKLVSRIATAWVAMGGKIAEN